MAFASILKDPEVLPSQKRTWKSSKKGPIETTVLLKGDYMGFHVSLWECTSQGLHESQKLSIVVGSILSKSLPSQKSPQPFQFKVPPLLYVLMGRAY